VAICLGGVAATCAQAGATHEWLSPAERLRLDGISAPSRRRQFVAGRWLARRLLGASQGGDFLQGWPLSADPSEPPRLLRPCPKTLHIALSHSGDHVVCAIAAKPVGVDIEATGRRRDIDLLVSGVCTDDEQARLRSVDSNLRPGHFYAMWTLKEAWLKRACEGVSPGRLARLHTRAAGEGEAFDALLWRGGGFVLACAVDPTMQLRWYGAPAGAGAAERWCIEAPTSSAAPSGSSSAIMAAVMATPWG
jgi:4'-phosphopantetheinyl transferase